MWILDAFLSALFAGITAVLAKIGIRNTDSHLATALRTVVVLAFAWLMVFVAGAQHTLWDISAKSLIFLILSGLCTGGSWICYFRALQLGDVNKVVPIDKASILLTMVMAFVFLREPISLLKGVSMTLIGAGTWLMIQRKDEGDHAGRGAWLVYAVLSAVFAAATSILGKVGIEAVESNLGTAIRTGVVLILAWGLSLPRANSGRSGKLAKRAGSSLSCPVLQRDFRGCSITGPCRTDRPALWCRSTS